MTIPWPKSVPEVEFWPTTGTKRSRAFVKCRDCHRCLPHAGSLSLGRQARFP